MESFLEKAAEQEDEAPPPTAVAILMNWVSPSENVKCKQKIIGDEFVDKSV